MGVNSTELNLGTQRPGTRAEPFGSVARYWNLWRGVDVRVQAIAGAKIPRALTLTADNGCADCAVWSSRQFAGINSALTYEWRQGRALRPYVLGGGGALFTHARQHLEAPCASTNSCTFVDPGFDSRVRSDVAFSYTLGTGVAFRLGKADMFAELARHGVTRGATALTPLSIGLRF